jgi:shikimate kinase
MTTTLEERAPLYDAVANLKVDTERCRPPECAQEIADWLKVSCS